MLRGGILSGILLLPLLAGCAEVVPPTTPEPAMTPPAMTSPAIATAQATSTAEATPASGPHSPLPTIQARPGDVLVIERSLAPGMLGSTARFTSADGAARELAFLHEDAASVTLAVPLFLDPATGALGSGALTLLLQQGAAWGPIARVEVGPLPQAPGEPGDVTLAALRMEARNAAARASHLAFWQRALNESVNLSRETADASVTSRFAALAAQMVANGSFSEGIGNADRILALWFSGVAAMGDVRAMSVAAGGAGIRVESIARELDLETVDRIASGVSDLSAVDQARSADGDVFDRLLAVTSGILAGFNFIGAKPPPEPGVALGGSAAALATRDVTRTLFDTIARANEGAVTGEDVAEPSLERLGGKLLAGFLESGSTVLDQLHGGLELAGLGSYGRSVLSSMGSEDAARGKLAAALESEPYDDGVGWVTGSVVDEARGSGLDHVFASFCITHDAYTADGGRYAIPFPGGDNAVDRCSLLAWQPPGVTLVGFGYDLDLSATARGEDVALAPVKGKYNETLARRVDGASPPSRGTMQAPTVTPPATARLAFQGGTLPAAETDAAYSYDFCRRADTAASGPCGGEGTRDPTGGAPPYHFQLETAGGFPPMGLVLAPSGALSGTPSVAGSTRFSVCAVDTVGAQDCRPFALNVVQGKCRSPLEGNWSGTLTQTAFKTIYVPPDYARGIASHWERGESTTIRFTLDLTLECEGEWSGPNGQRPGEGGLAFKVTRMRASAPELDCTSGCTPTGEIVYLLPAGASPVGYIDVTFPNKWNLYSGPSAGTIGVSADGATMYGTKGQVYLPGPSDLFLHRARGWDGADPWEWSIAKIP